MASGCKSAACCVDSQMPVRATYVNLYKWPESDAEFVRSVTRGPRVIQRKFGGPGPAVVDSYSCRQMFLRSYTFSKKKESVPEKTIRCFGKVKERATVLLLRECGDDGKSGKKRKKSKKTKKSCATVKKLKEASCSAVRSIFRRLLACTSTVDVVDCSTQD